jgi:hypothetical protein
MALDDALRDRRLGAKEDPTLFRLQSSGGWPAPIVTTAARK